MQRILAALLIAVGSIVGLFVAVAPIEAGGGGACLEKPREGSAEPVTIRRGCFSPSLLQIESGDTVTWNSTDEVEHNVTFLDGTQADNDASLRYGESVRHTFEAPGVYAYYCTVHPWMLGVVAVGDATSFAAQPASPSPEAPAAATAVSAESSSRLSPGLAGLVLGVGLVSAGGGYLLRQRGR